MNITIHGNEKNKTEVIYNNIVETMQDLELSEADQIEYLKTRLTALEVEIQRKIAMSFTILAGFLGIALGIYFVMVDQYLFGIILSFGTLILVLYRMYIILKQYLLVGKDQNYDKIEHLRKILNRRLK